MSSFSGSKKVYVEGSRPDIKVPMREIELSPTTGTFGEEENPPVRVYDTSGPYTDRISQLIFVKGLPAITTQWILERGDVEEYEGREIKPEDNGYKDENDPRANTECISRFKTKTITCKKREKCHTTALCTKRNHHS